MKKGLLYTGILLLSFLVINCKKEDNAKLPDLKRVPVPNITLDASAPISIPVSTLSSFSAKIKVAMFFKDDIPPQKMDLVAYKNGETDDIKVIHGDIVSFPTDVTITGDQLKTAFGSVNDCDYFTFGVNITTKDGTLYEAFPKTGIPWGSGNTGQFPDLGNLQTSFRYNTKVEYRSEQFSGAFVAVSDEFGDFVDEKANVTLTQIDATHFSFIQPAVTDPIPMIVEVDPNTLRATIKKQKIGSAFDWELSYTNPVAEVVSSGDSFVSPCAGTLTLIIKYSVDQGGFGGYKLVLKKKS